MRNGSFLGAIFYLILFVSLGFFLCLIFTSGTKVDDSTKTTIIGSILSHAIGLSGLLITVVGVLVAIYWSTLANDIVRKKLQPLIWWVVVIIFVSAFAGLLALVYSLFKLEYLFTFIIAAFVFAVYMIVGAVIMVVARLVR